MLGKQQFFCLVQCLYVLYIFYIYISIYLQTVRQKRLPHSIYISLLSLAFLHMNLHIFYKKRQDIFRLFYSLWTVTHFGIPCEISLSYTHMHRTTKNIKQTVMTSITIFTMNSCKPLPWFTHQHQFHSTTKRHI